MLIFLAIKVDDVFSTENSGSTCHYERLKNKYVFHCDIIVMILLNIHTRVYCKVWFGLILSAINILLDKDKAILHLKIILALY